MNRCPTFKRKGCQEGNCPGWGWFNGREVQACDLCRRFKAGDDGAMLHILKCDYCSRRLARVIKHLRQEWRRDVRWKNAMELAKKEGDRP